MAATTVTITATATTAPATARPLSLTRHLFEADTTTDMTIHDTTITSNTITPRKRLIS
eukprot:m.509616 g.509616  ORF g.509616 m.509616 type:complete len:58 (+) comp93794_c0_seq1:77-250(+)